MLERLAVLVHPTARVEVQQRVSQLVDRVGGRLYPLHHPIESLPKAEVYCIVSGDGTKSAVIKKLLESDQDPLVLDASGGSENGLNASLKAAGITINAADFSLNKRYKIPYFYPGMIEGGVFNHIAGFGEFLSVHSSMGERLRGLTPREIKMKLAGIIALTTSHFRQNEDNDPFDMVLMSSCIGSKKFPLNHSLHSRDLVRIGIESSSRYETLAKLIGLFSCFMLKRLPPTDIARIDKGDAFPLGRGYLEGNVDGELMPFAGRDYKVARRSAHGLRVAALLV
jgi:hypothetical protein